MSWRLDAASSLVVWQLKRSYQTLLDAAAL
jgi:hypothetical protein